MFATFVCWKMTETSEIQDPFRLLECEVANIFYISLALEMQSNQKNKKQKTSKKNNTSKELLKLKIINNKNIGMT